MFRSIALVSDVPPIHIPSPATSVGHYDGTSCTKIVTEFIVARAADIHKFITLHEENTTR